MLPNYRKIRNWYAIVDGKLKRKMMEKEVSDKEIQRAYNKTARMIRKKLRKLGVRGAIFFEECTEYDAYEVKPAVLLCNISPVYPLLEEHEEQLKKQLRKKKYGFARILWEEFGGRMHWYNPEVRKEEYENVSKEERQEISH